MKPSKAITAFLIATFLAGCASSPSPPREELAAADLAVRQVQGTAASDYAAGDVRQAQQKLEAARAAMERESYTEARRMAEQALIDAQVADVRVDAARSGEILAQSEEDIQALEREALELQQ